MQLLKWAASLSRFLSRFLVWPAALSLRVVLYFAVEVRERLSGTSPSRGSDPLPKESKSSRILSPPWSRHSTPPGSSGPGSESK